MNFLLEKFENHLPEEDLLKGESWYEAGAVKYLREAEKHLWVAGLLPPHEPACEVEIQITPSKVSGASCDCGAFAGRHICPHLVAAPFSLRKYLRQEKERKAATKEAAQTSGNKRLTVPAILEQVPNASLIEFLQEYARQNRAFAIALKSRFASAVQTHDEKDKYLQLIQTVISAGRKSGGSLTKKGSTVLSELLQDLFRQADEDLHAGNFAETLALMQAIIEKVSPIIKKVTAPVPAIQEAVPNAFTILDQLVQRNIPPGLRQLIWEYCLAEARRPTYILNQLEGHFLSLALRLAPSFKGFDQVEKLLQDLFGIAQHFKLPVSTLLLAQYSLYIQSGKLAKARDLVLEHLHEPQLLIVAIQQALGKNEQKLAQQLAEKGLGYPSCQPVHEQLEDILLEIALENGDKDAIIKWASTLFLRNFDKKHHLLIKATDPAGWLNRRNELEKQLQLGPALPARRKALAEIFAEDGEWADLFQLLEQSRSIELLQQYDRKLLDTMPEQILNLYESMLKEYLQHFIGRSTSKSVRQILQHLFSIGADELANRLIQEFRVSYPERHTLMEELSWT